ncbi:hypothetical protein [Sphingomonas sp.]
MTTQRSRFAGGAPLALLLLVGTIVGATFQQPAIGFFAGLGLGVALSLVIWLRDRRRDPL